MARQPLEAFGSGMSPVGLQELLGPLPSGAEGDGGARRRVGVFTCVPSETHMLVNVFIRKSYPVLLP